MSNDSRRYPPSRFLCPESAFYRPVFCGPTAKYSSYEQAVWVSAWGTRFLQNQRLSRFLSSAKWANGTTAVINVINRNQSIFCLRFYILVKNERTLRLVSIHDDKNSNRKYFATWCKIIIWLNKATTLDVRNRLVGSTWSKDWIFGSWGYNCNERSTCELSV